MAALAFVSSFAGVGLNCNNSVQQSSALRNSVPRSAMGDSIAPKIVIIDTKSDQTSKVKIIWEPVLPNASAAVMVTGNMALATSLKSNLVSSTAPPAVDKGPVPEGISPADFYFPKDTRNQAPVIGLEYDSKITVSMDEINPVVGGVAANSVDKQSVAFWKVKTPKYSVADLPAPSPDCSEPISTRAFEKYFPSRLRNMAPAIEIRPPKGDWDKTAYIIVKNEYVKFNPTLITALNLPDMGPKGTGLISQVVDKYYGKEMYFAPSIRISEEAESVEFGFDEVPLPEADAGVLLKTLRMQYTKTYA